MVSLPGTLEMERNFCLRVYCSFFSHDSKEGKNMQNKVPYSVMTQKTF